jgi:hypothetical protein
MYATLPLAAIRNGRQRGRHWGTTSAILRAVEAFLRGDSMNV